MDTNPYKPPVALDTMYGKPDAGTSRVEGKQLVVRSGAVLPQRCVKTNQKITEEDLRRKTFEWCSPWVALSFLVSGCIMIVLYFVFRRQCSITFGMHSSVRKRYRNWLLFKVLATVALFASLPFVAATDSGGLIATVLILFIFAFITCFIGNSPLSIAKHREGEFWIKGCCPEFLSQIGGGAPFSENPFAKPEY
jgi:hypothetical protein